MDIGKTKKRTCKNTIRIVGYSVAYIAGIVAGFFMPDQSCWVCPVGYPARWRRHFLDEVWGLEDSYYTPGQCW